MGQRNLSGPDWSDSNADPNCNIKGPCEFIVRGVAGYCANSWPLQFEKDERVTSPAPSCLRTLDSRGEKTMKRWTITALAGLLLTANLANAEGIFSLDRFSLGLSAAQANVDVNDVGVNVNGEATGWRFFGIYDLNDRFSLEGGISSFDRSDDPSVASIPEVENESFDLFAVGTFPLSDKFDLFGKAGFVSWTTEVEESELSEFSSRSTDLALGLGGEYDLNTRLSIRGEYLWTDSNNSGAADTMSVAAIFHFQ